ncbi:RND multidrug efflux transporter; Acriflavin resistance protein [plant metagenome]|uniref:RND multidrug efflux transporter Acriflavin resistance protein n=1 Tax=plant metagenome TaxID=1297885 RepID=A0A484S599_9ZZZZ
MNLSRPFVRRPVASLLLAIAVLLLGLLSWRLMPVSPLPQVDFPAIVVNANLPGADPETMASTVAAPLERAMGSIAGVTALRSSSNTGSTTVMLQFELDRDINDAARDVQAAINAAQATLPSGMPSRPSYRKINPSQAPVLTLALSSRDLSPGKLYDVASTILAQKIAQVPGVGDVTVSGASLPAVRVQLNPNALAAYGIALDDVRRALTDANPLRPRGDLVGNDLQWQIQTSDQMRRAEEYRPLIIRYVDGRAVRLGDIATVTDSVENRYSSGFHNNEPAVSIEVSRQPGANIVETIDAINAQLPALHALVPASAELKVVLDRSPVIRATLREAQVTLLLAAGLVVLVVLGFLGSLRAALIPSVAIPVSLIGTFTIMYLYGFSLNNLSLMALIVAAGLVVDDAIVVMENIQRHIERGLTPFRAAMRGAGEVGFTLLAMNVALIVVFVSILFMGGLVERLFREFSITLAAAMVVSLAVSLTLTPSLCARLLPRHDSTEPRNRLQAASERLFGRLLDGYSRSLRWSLRRAPWVLLILVGVVALNVTLYIAIPKGFLPEQDTGQLRAFVRGDDGASYQSMLPKMEIYRQLLLADPAVEDVVGSSGGGSRHQQRPHRRAPEASRRTRVGRRSGRPPAHLAARAAGRDPVRQREPGPAHAQPVGQFWQLRAHPALRRPDPAAPMGNARPGSHAQGAGDHGRGRRPWRRHPADHARHRPRSRAPAGRGHEHHHAGAEQLLQPTPGRHALQHAEPVPDRDGGRAAIHAVAHGPEPVAHPDRGRHAHPAVRGRKLPVQPSERPRQPHGPVRLRRHQLLRSGRRRLGAGDRRRAARAGGSHAAHRRAGAHGRHGLQLRAKRRDPAAADPGRADRGLPGAGRAL